MARGVTLKAEWIRSGTSHDIQQVRRLITKYVKHTNTFASTLPTDTSPRRTSFLAKKIPSLPTATQNSPRPGDNEKSNAKTNPFLA
jgi:hypothetical protein